MSGRPSYGGFRTRVTRTEHLSECFVRVTLGGDDLVNIGTDGLDQRIKLLLPLADGSFSDVGLFSDTSAGLNQWYPTWRALPDDRRNPLRTYTIRHPRPDSREIAIDFVLHAPDGDEPEGPASSWARGATVGDELIVIGPDSRGTESGGGIGWHPGSARTVLLAGDETAAPAICAIVEALGPEISGDAYIEVPHADDRWPVPTQSQVRVTWLPRHSDHGTAAHGSHLEHAVHAWAADDATPAPGIGGEVVDPEPDGILWDVPEEGAGARYAWLAGEAGVITALRRHLVRDRGWDRGTVAFMGYWKRGRAEGA